MKCGGTAEASDPEYSVLTDSPMILIHLFVNITLSSRYKSRRNDETDTRTRIQRIPCHEVVDTESGFYEARSTEVCSNFKVDSDGLSSNGFNW